jgi:hypothetical protein
MQTLLSVIDSMSAFPTQFQPGVASRVMSKPRDLERWAVTVFVMKYSRRECRVAERMTTGLASHGPHVYRREEYAIVESRYVAYLYDWNTSEAHELEQFRSHAAAMKFLAGRGARSAAAAWRGEAVTESWRARFGD